MSDLARYHSQADRIADLEAQVAGLQDELSKCQKMKSQYKSKWRLAMGEYEFPTDKARRMVAESKLAGYGGTVMDECRRIGKAVGIKALTVKTSVWYGKAGC